MKYILFFTSLFISVAALAQQPDSIILRAYYIATLKQYADQQNLQTDEKVLDVSHNHTEFYSRWKKRRDEIVDSISQAKKNGAKTSTNDLIKATSNIPRSQESYFIYDNYPKNGVRTVTDRLLKKFYYEENITPINWELASGDTTILDIPCLAAKCEYGGRKWTVYYASSIPIQEGPWKLKGLPGLILYAKEDTGVFSFECIGIKKGEGVFEAPDLANYIKCTRKELNQMKSDNAADPSGFEKRFGLSGRAWGPDGKPIQYKKRTALFIEN